MRIMVVSDTHLGFMEDDPIRGNDSFITFEEILQQARDMQVDFILHGGDLFHDNKPSRKTMHRTVELLRSYCLGERPVKINVLSDQRLNFTSKFQRVNYEDPNFNVDLPFFAVHGNHDDPAGHGALSSLDLLSAINFVNYFGKTPSVDDISIYPILLQKGTTRVALYGLGNIRDERLYRTFQQQKVRMMRPVEERDSWFNIMILHQNRAAHSPKNFIHEVFLEEWLDMVVWGHEHECLIEPTRSVVGNFFISQPGSSVATSLSDGEAKRKCLGVLEVRGDKFRMRTHPLRTVRPLVIETIVLGAVPRLMPDNGAELSKVLTDRVDEIVAAATQAAQGTPAPLPPLVRLKVEYSGGFGTVAAPRFGQAFVGKVANPADILLFFKKRNTTGAGTRKKSAKPMPGDNEMGVLEALRTNKAGEQIDIESTITQLMSESLDRPIVLGEPELNTALRAFVDKDDKDAIADLVKKQLTERKRALLADAAVVAAATEPVIRDWLFKDAERRREAAAAAAAAEAAGDVVRGEVVAAAGNNNNDDDDDDDGNDNAVAAVAAVAANDVDGDFEEDDGERGAAAQPSAVKRERVSVKREAVKRNAGAKRNAVFVVSDDENDDDDDNDANVVVLSSKKSAPRSQPKRAATRKSAKIDDDDNEDDNDNDADDKANDDGVVAVDDDDDNLPSNKRARTSAAQVVELKAELPSQRTTSARSTKRSWANQRK
jgi:double-strand break repair protein MRE11